MRDPRDEDSQPTDSVLSFADHALTDDFLAPDEANFPLLVSRIAWLHRCLTAKGSKRPGMRDMPLAFRYSEQLKNSQIPWASQSRAAAFDASLEAFEGTFRPHHPHSMFNIAPSPMIDAVAIAALTLMNNPNGIWDLSCGKFSLIEQRIIRYMGDLAAWTSPADGVFTSGGKATLMYAVKMGLNASDPEVVHRGITNNYVVISSSQVHFSLESVCNFLGLGRGACIRVPAGSDGRLDPSAFQSALVGAIEAGKTVCAVILAGGPLIDTRADPVRRVRAILTEAAQQGGMVRVPSIHLDCVVTWPWLAFGKKRVDDLGRVDDRVARSILSLAEQVAEVDAADSFGVDFHKTGLAPYASSCFVTKNSAGFRRLNYLPAEEAFEEESYGQFCSFDRTFENSRSCVGIIVAYYVLQRLGVSGLQRYVIRYMEIADRLRALVSDEFAALGTVINRQSLGFDVIVRLNLGMDASLVADLEQSPVVAQQEYARLAMGFREWTLSSPYCRTSPVPVLGYVPRYGAPGSGLALPAFLLFPNSLFSTEIELRDVLLQLTRTVDEFVRQKDHIELGEMDWEGRPLPPR
jgi:glutamate/tyrosine decarboxylase-like PLP-dependent enzyme